MPVSRLLKALLVKVVRNTVGRLGRVLRPSAAADRDSVAEAPVIELFAPSDATDPDDGSATRELLLAAAHDEPPAARASRQARIYLERRRRQLNAELHTGP